MRTLTIETSKRLRVFSRNPSASRSATGLSLTAKSIEVAWPLIEEIAGLLECEKTISGARFSVLMEAD